MSYYLSICNLDETLKKTGLDYTIRYPEENSIVATQKNKKLLYKDYTEEKLKSMVLDETDVLVDNKFWNFNYCNTENIENKSITGDNIIVDLNNYIKGKLILDISMTDIVTDIFKVKHCKKYLNSLNIDKSCFSKFLINFDNIIPLTECYLELIVRIFQPNNILDFLFGTKPRFNLDETETILNEIEFGSLNSSSIYIFSMNISACQKLKYLEILLNIYQDDIDITETVYTNMEHKNNYLGYYLLSLDLEEDLYNKYLDIIKIYIDKKGSIDFRIIDNKEIDNKIVKRKTIIKCSSA